MGYQEKRGDYPGLGLLDFGLRLISIGQRQYATDYSQYYSNPEATHPAYYAEDREDKHHDSPSYVLRWLRVEHYCS